MTSPTAVQATSDTVERDGKHYRLINEGKAAILVPQAARAAKGDGKEQKVFYNPIQQYNRDLSILAIKAYGEWALERRPPGLGSKMGVGQGKNAKKRKRSKENSLPPEPDAQPVIAHEPAVAHDKEPTQTEAPKTPKPAFKILDALSASGLRALRYAHELPFVTSVTANDLSASAAVSIALNVEHNGLQDIVSVTNQDALALMYRSIADDLSARDRHVNPGRSHKFDVVDLDPYGSAAPFFDAAVQSVRDDGGLLCVTCTDSAVWAGHSYCEKTFALYGGTPIKGMHSHEAALRLILSAVATSGAKYGLAVEPLLSLSIDFYSKIFVKVTRSPQAVKFLGSRTMLVYSCDHGCGSWETQPLLRTKPTPNKKGDGSFYRHVMALGTTADRLCQHCNFKMHVNGPMYAGHIHSQGFIQRVLDQIPGASPEVYGTLTRLEGMLRTAQEEHIPGPTPPNDVAAKEAELATIDHCPFFVIPGKLASVVSCATPPDDMFRGALIHLGYQTGRSHCRPGSIKTNAPWSTIWWVMTEWIRQKSPVNVSKFKPSMAAWKILHDAGLVGQEGGGTEGSAQGSDDANMESVEERPAGEHAEAAEPGSEHSSREVKATASESELRKTLVFDETLASLGRQQGSQRYVRYQMNPQPHWGPMTRAKGH